MTQHLCVGANDNAITSSSFTVANSNDVFEFNHMTNAIAASGSTTYDNNDIPPAFSRIIRDSRATSLDSSDNNSNGSVENSSDSVID